MFIELTKEDGSKEILNPEYILFISVEDGKRKVYFTPEHGRRWESYKESYASIKELLEVKSNSGSTMMQ